MRIEVLDIKINEAIVEKSDVAYEGSITLPSDVIKESGLLQYRKVDINNMTNGNRITTYVLEGDSVQINGAASILFCVGDKIHILAYASIAAHEVHMHEPHIINLDKNNKPT